MGKYVECQNCQEQYDCERTYLGGCTDGEEWEEKPLLSKSDKEFYFALMTNCKKVIEKCPNIEERRLACEYCRFEQVRKKAVEEYERKLADGELVSKDWHDEQVLHLQNEIEYLDGCAKQFLADYQKCEIENAELQKQVDELKEQRDVFKRLFESVNTSNFSTNSIIETMNSFYREQAEHLAGLKIEQAVKDTAKEIFDSIFEVLFCFTTQGKSKKYAEGFIDCLEEVDKRLQNLAKEKYGVEVE